MTKRVRTLSPGTSVTEACSNLNQFVQIEATAVAQIVGFGWQPDPKAPADFRSLQKAYVRSQVTGYPLPVSDEHTESSIYGTTEANVAFRFWHDVTHVRLDENFDLDSEIEVARAQLDILAAAGFEPGSLEYELFHADTLGQTLSGVATGAFPKDQLCFAHMSLGSSLTLAIRAEVETRHV